MSRLSCTLAALAAIALLAAPVAAKNQSTRGVAKVRVIDDFFSTDVPQSAKLDVRIGKASDPSANPVKFTVSYGDVSRRAQRIKAGTNTVAIYLKDSTTSPLATMTGPLRGGERKTIFLYASSPAGAFTAASSTRSPASRSTARRACASSTASPTPRRRARASASSAPAASAASSRTRRPRS
jgi:hypothetical protein